jgi:hypothetical protein
VCICVCHPCDQSTHPHDIGCCISSAPSSFPHQTHPKSKFRDLPICLAEHPHTLLTPPALVMRLELHKGIDWRNPCGEDGAYRRTTIRVPVEVSQVKLSLGLSVGWLVGCVSSWVVGWLVGCLDGWWWVCNDYASDDHDSKAPPPPQKTTQTPPTHHPLSPHKTNKPNPSAPARPRRWPFGWMWT